MDLDLSCLVEDVTVVMVVKTKNMKCDNNWQQQQQQDDDDFKWQQRKTKTEKMLKLKTIFTCKQS